MAELTPRALCTVEDVKDDLGDDLAIANLDNAIIRRINAASDLIADRAGREFVGPAAAETRRFDLASHRRLATRELRLGDVQDVTAVVLEDEDGDVVQALASGEWTLLPRVRRRPWEPYTRLRFHDSVGLSDSLVAAVTGTWGFPAIPEAIVQATITQVELWLHREVRYFSETFSNEEGRPSRPRELDSAIAAVADTFRRRRL